MYGSRKRSRKSEREGGCYGKKQIERQKTPKTEEKDEINQYRRKSLYGDEYETFDSATKIQ